VSFVFGFAHKRYHEHDGKVPCISTVVFIFEYGIVKLYSIRY
jgi:hypothetical protein